MKNESLSNPNVSLSNLIRQSLLHLPLLALLLTAALTISCKSAPKRTMLINVVYNSSYELISSANGCILTGDYEKAQNLLEEAYTKAMSIDNYELLVSACLSQITLNLSKNPRTQNDIEIAKQKLEIAKEFVPFSTITKRQEALIALNEVRINTSQSDEKTDFSSLIQKLQANRPGVKGDVYYEAQFTAAEADIYKAKKDYNKADELYVEAANLYTKNRYLSEIGITWYKAAQVRSLANKKEQALKALENAIYYDRASENSTALGTDYYAKGIILLKGNPTAKEKQDAKFAFNHSTEIFDSIKQHELAKISAQKAEEIQ
ncbi:MAG: hypothetical protein K6A43_05610 [Treponema sp.]|nr:hypothetical protein [Treponema sp.]